MSCKIVCPAACRNCDVAPCDDRMAEQENVEKRVQEAAQAAGMTGTELYEFWSGHSTTTGRGMTLVSPYEDRTDDVKVDEALKHCGMADAILCRHCHEEACAVRKAPRTF